MIVVAGLSPAWQQIMEFDRLLPGEVNRAVGVHWCASGKVLNVGLALAHLQSHAVTVAPLGESARQPIAQEFAALGARSEWIDVAAPTRICTTLLDRSTGQTTELVENAGPLSDEEIGRFEETCTSLLESAEVVVLTGSIPPGVSADVFRRLLESTSARAVLDIRGAELEAALACRPLVVKPNREELGHTVGRPLHGEVELRAAMLELNRRGAQWVVVSHGKHALWASGAGVVYRLTPPEVQAVNPIASGDCLAAGMAWQLSQGATVLDSLRVGVAAASLNATTLLPARLNADEVLALAATLQVDEA